MTGLFFQLLRFGLVGSMNTLIDSLIYIGLTRSIPLLQQWYLVAAFISFCVAGIVGFFSHKYVTFRHDTPFQRSQLIHFYIGAGGALLINEVVLWGLVRLGLNDIIAKVCASVIAGGCNFVVQKFWTFHNAQGSSCRLRQTSV